MTQGPYREVELAPDPKPRRRAHWPAIGSALFLAFVLASVNGAWLLSGGLWSVLAAMLDAVALIILGALSIVTLVTRHETEEPLFWLSEDE